MPQVQFDRLIGRDGRLLVANNRTRCKAVPNFAGATYFAAQADGDTRNLRQRRAHLDGAVGQGADVFDLSRRLPVGRWIVPRRHRDRGAAELLR